MRLFGKRYEEAIFAKKITISIPRRLRKRIMAILEKNDFTYGFQPDPSDRWTEETSILQELPTTLCNRYGVDKLTAFNDKNVRSTVNLKGFVCGAYPAQVFDVIELFYSELPPSENFQGRFSKDINNIFEEENFDWRLMDGQLFKIDSAFLRINVMSPAYELLKTESFKGALDELNEAQKDLNTGDYKGAIHNACKSFESVLKAILEKETGNAGSLISELYTRKFYADIPDSAAKAIGESVFHSLPFLRNRLGGHGQGENVLNVPKLYAELSIHLAAVFNLFLIRKATEIGISPAKTKKETINEQQEHSEEDSSHF